jgi:3-phenylpropionate/trans-cinnamate dioxygenase ferredoxin reductase subunit
MKNGVVIVGAGHAGVQAAASLRDEGYDGPVTLIGDENELPYHKPPLSKTFIKDSAAVPQILRAEAFYETGRIELRRGVLVERIDPVAKRLDLAGGGSIPFDAAILATGSRPRVLRLGGGELGGVLSLRSVADARSIRDLSAQVEDVVILGGGFIGLEIAATLFAGGRRVTVIEAQDRLLGRAVAPAISSHVRQRLEASGIRVLTQTTVERLEGSSGRVEAAIASTGERLPAQMVIIGIGVVPNMELAAEAGLETANGIRVDQQMRTSVPEILAIGDNASYRHWFSGADVRLESVQNATDQARLAARTITGHQDLYRSVPWFWSDIGDMKLQMVGLAQASDRSLVVGDVGDNKFSVFHYGGERLIAIESVNRPADHMLGRKMLGAGFSPSVEVVAAGADAVKSAFMDAQKQVAADPA